MTVKGSDWLGLNKHLIASFFEVDSSGNRINQDVTVEAPIVDGNFEATLNWQSPFEGAGPESSAPTFTAMLQSGNAQHVLSPVSDFIGKVSGGLIDLKEQTDAALAGVEGKTGITKLNSVQVFTGMPPIKIPITILFRAWQDANKEVETPFDQMMKWSLPVELADSGMLRELIKQGDLQDIMFPSTVPTLIGMKYKNRLYSPMVIESIGFPLTSSIEQNGKFTELSVQLTLATLAAYDRSDWDRVNAG